MKWIALAGAVVRVLLTGLASPAQAAYPGKNGKIAFSSDRDHPSAPCFSCRAIYTMNPDGTGVTKLTNGPDLHRTDRDPAWSPDGKRIVFAGSASAGSFLYVMNADGSGLAQIPNTGFNAYSPSWSPDGSRIAFANIAGRRELGCRPFEFNCDSGLIYDIFTVGIDGSGSTQLTFGNRSDADPAWSPNGGEIAFVSNRFTDDPYSAHQLVWKMNADGSNQTRVTAFATFEHDPRLVTGRESARL